MNWKEWQEYSQDETNWLHNDERGLLKVEHVKEFILRLWFEEALDVSIYELDCYSLFVQNNPGGVFEQLRDPERFRMVDGDYSLIWLNPKTGEYDEMAIDIAPEAIRYFCEKYGRKLKGAGNDKADELIAA